MFGDSCNASELISKGDVVRASGSTLEEIFTSICSQAKLPSGLAPDVLVKELINREKILSTAVGNGIAIPHPSRTIVKNENESCIIVAYLDSPIGMQAPDLKRVSSMFILLSSSSRQHIKSLSSLAILFRKENFKNGLQSKPDKNELVQLVKKCEAMY